MTDLNDASRQAAPTFQGAVPIIRIFDVAKAKEFYVGFLGFEIAWEHQHEPGAPLYAEVVRSGLKLHFSEHYGDASPGATVYVETQGVETFQAELAARNYPYMRPGLQETDYGHTTMEVLDPFGNRLRFSQPVAD